MKAIYKKEVKSYLTSMIGYVFIFFILLLEGIYFTAYNLQNAYPLFGTTLSAAIHRFRIIWYIHTAASSTRSGTCHHLCGKIHTI